MDIIDIMLIQKKHDMELAGEEWDRWGKIMQDKKDSYVNLLKIKESQKSNPEEYDKFVSQIIASDKKADEILLDMDKPYHRRFMEKILKK